MRKAQVVWSVVGMAVVAIAILFLLNAQVCKAEEVTGPKLEKPKMLDGVMFNPDGSLMWIDSYINSVRPGIQFWLDEKSAMKYVRRIRFEANFLLIGAGKNREEVTNRVKNNVSTEEFFRKAFCTEIENGKNCEKVCVGDPDDYAILMVRMIPDSPMRNTNFLFSYIEKKVAYDLGCRDEDVVEYMKKRGR